jgi:hypothetical protein
MKSRKSNLFVLILKLILKITDFISTNLNIRLETFNKIK